MVLGEEIPLSVSSFLFFFYRVETAPCGEKKALEFPTEFIREEKIYNNVRRWDFTIYYYFKSLFSGLI